MKIIIGLKRKMLKSRAVAIVVLMVCGLFIATNVWAETTYKVKVRNIGNSKILVSVSFRALGRDSFFGWRETEAKWIKPYQDNEWENNYKVFTIEWEIRSGPGEIKIEAARVGTWFYPFRKDIIYAIDPAKPHKESGYRKR